MRGGSAIVRVEYSLDGRGPQRVRATMPGDARHQGGNERTHTSTRWQTWTFLSLIGLKPPLITDSRAQSRQQRNAKRKDSPTLEGQQIAVKDATGGKRGARRNVCYLRQTRVFQDLCESTSNRGRKERRGKVEVMLQQIGAL